MSKLNSSMYAMRKIKNILKCNHDTYIKKVFTMQKKCIRIMTRSKYNDHTTALFKKLEILKLEDMFELQIAKYMYNFAQYTLPRSLMMMINFNDNVHSHNTRHRHHPHVNRRRTILASKTLRHKGPEIWYKISDHVILTRTVHSFSKYFKKKLLTKY